MLFQLIKSILYRKHHETYYQGESGVSFGIHCQLHHKYVIRTPPKDNSEELTRADRIKNFAPTPEHPFVLGLPTGSSPVIIYRILVEKFKAGEISFENVVTFNMVSSQISAQGTRYILICYRMNILASPENIPKVTTHSCTSTSSRTSIFIPPTSISWTGTPRISKQNV